MVRQNPKPTKLHCHSIKIPNEPKVLYIIKNNNKILNNGTSWYLRNELKPFFFNWLYSPRRNLRLFTWSFSTWYLNEPPREKVFPQHLTVPGHFVSSTTYFIHPSSFFFSPPMTCVFLAEGKRTVERLLNDGRGWWGRCYNDDRGGSRDRHCILCYRSNIFPTTLRLVWYGRSGTFRGTLALYFVEC